MRGHRTTRGRLPGSRRAIVVASAAVISVGALIIVGSRLASADGPNITTLSTAVFDTSTIAVWSGAEVTGASAYDTSTLGGLVNGTVPTGTVTYVLYGDSTCTAALTSPEQVTLDTGGNVPDSSATAPLAAGSYSYQATYSGDSFYSQSTSCEPFTVLAANSTTSTTVDDALTKGPWDGTEQTGASAYDTSTVTSVTGIRPTGTVIYSFFLTSDCSGSAETQTVTLSAGNVPNSSTTSPLAAGAYSYMATYGGDGNYSGSSGSCETFSVGMTSVTVNTEVDDPALSAAWTGNEVIGSSAYDTATITGVGGFTPTGTISYMFWTNGTCNGVGSDVGSVLTLGSPSSIQVNLGGGSYSFKATYSGDSNYSSSTSGCEPFTVLTTSTTISTTVDDALTSSPWGATEKAGASAFDTAVVGGGVAGFTPTGTVTYTLFLNGTCMGTPAPQDVALSGGTVPNSSSTGSLGAGSYSFQGTYSGDSNYSSSGPSGCEPFTVAQGNSSIATSVDDALTNSTWTTTETTGASAFDTSTVTGVSGVTPTGSVAYNFFMNLNCSGSPAATTTVNLSGGACRTRARQLRSEPAHTAIRPLTTATPAMLGQPARASPSAWSRRQPR